LAVVAQKAASARAASIVSAHTAGQIISIVTVPAADQSAAVVSRSGCCQASGSLGHSGGDGKYRSPNSLQRQRPPCAQGRDLPHSLVMA
jgi:ABC-type cobalamin transport system ATPase subunit